MSLDRVKWFFLIQQLLKSKLGTGELLYRRFNKQLLASICGNIRPHHRSDFLENGELFDVEFFEPKFESMLFKVGANLLQTAHTRRSLVAVYCLN